MISPSYNMKDAFLNGSLDVEIGYELTKSFYGYELTKSFYVCELTKSFYGLKYAGRNWFDASLLNVTTYWSCRAISIEMIHMKYLGAFKYFLGIQEAPVHKEFNVENLLSTVFPMVLFILVLFVVLQMEQTQKLLDSTDDLLIV